MNVGYWGNCFVVVTSIKGGCMFLKSLLLAVWQGVCADGGLDAGAREAAGALEQWLAGPRSILVTYY